MAITKTFHTLGHRLAVSGSSYKIRSYVQGRANVMAITGSVVTNSWSPVRWIRLQLHSSYSWKSPVPEHVTASTEMYLNRPDAEAMLTALLSALAEWDRQEEASKT